MMRRSVELETDTGVEAAAAELSACGHALIRVTSSRHTEFMDITDRIARLVSASGISLGVVNVQSLHTTTGVVVNEHEPLLLKDFEATLAKTIPGDAVYSHD